MKHTQSASQCAAFPVPAQLPAHQPPHSSPRGEPPVSQPLRLHEPGGAAAVPPRPGEVPDISSDPDISSEKSACSATVIVDGILKAAHRLRGQLSGHFAEFDLTDVRYAVLRFLEDSEPHGCTQSEIAEHLDQSESSISTLVKRMRNSGLLYRLRSGIDKRKWVLKLTDRGRGLLDSVHRCHAQRMDDLLGAFDAAERAMLVDLVEKLVEELTPQEVASQSSAPPRPEGGQSAGQDREERPVASEPARPTEPPPASPAA